MTATVTRIADLLVAGPTLSFEFSPPKNDEAARRLDDTVEALARLRPSFTSVTYGALGSTRDRTRDAVERISKRYTFPCMAHLTCVGHSRAELEELLAHYRANDVHNILALAGDPPADGSDPGGDYTYASELVELVRELDHFSIGVACHPEIHPRSADRVSDRQRLTEKLAVADFAITQFFFDVADYTTLVAELADLGCTKPVLPGVMPFTGVAGLRRMAAINNTRVPDDLNARLEEVADDPPAVRAIGVDVATELARQLLDAGAPGVHLYTMNRADSVTEVTERLGLRPV
ncbi:MAG TPA: methylenetetrahydrofolate reductase [Acidimicrobiales bacterium]|jgi:methylenetetrahydrofolate reductase (NADPH)|nr:methylenetetrahydrofolate reductase [Acidimicrobiales bacterium]